LNDSDACFGSRATGIVLQGDGKIVVSGQKCIYGPDGPTGIVLRLLQDGGLDPSFGDGGIVTDKRVTAFDAVRVLPSGAIVAAGTNGSDAAVARLTSSGAPDPAFAAGGLRIVDYGGNDVVTDLVVQGGRPIITVQSGSTARIARFTVNGAADTSFGSGGNAVVRVGNSRDLAAVVLQTDGKVVAVGSADGDVLVVRLLINGSPDGSFGPGGARKRDLGLGIPDRANAVAVAGSRLLVAGQRGNDSVVLRYQLT
jgi:uncharacterized delta-60 repeat protein